MANIETPSLFHMLPQNHTGLVRMAAEAQHADEGHLVEFKTLAVRSILNKSVSKRRLWMGWSINPYRGCEFGCRYCYARYTHEFLAPKPSASAGSDSTGAGVDLRDPETFERLIFMKQNAAWLLEQELRKINPSDAIALGTATDPYQPIERRARITRSLLEVFARRSGYSLGIVTKSKLIERDIDLLSEIGRRNTLIVHLTITTPNAELARILEPRAPRPDLRFQTVKRLRGAGIRTGILCAPLLPGITDSEEAIDEMARRAAEVNASFFVANPLFLKPCSRPTYLSFVREHFPSLEAEYERRFAHADFAAKPYSQKLASIVERARRRYGLGRRSDDAPPTHDVRPEESSTSPRKQPESAVRMAQQRLFA